LKDGDTQELAPLAPSARRQLTRGERNILWCETHLHMPDAPHVGKPFKLPEFIKDDLRAFYDNVYGTRRLIICRGRKNAKSTECALIIALHLCGPEAKVNSQIYSCAQCREQAGVVFDILVKIIRQSPKLQNVITIREATKEMFCPQLGTFYKALSSEVSTAYGLNPSLVVFDELGQVRGPLDRLYEVMESATSAQPEPKTVIISTQSASDQDLLSILIDDALAGHDPTTKLRFDHTPMDMDPSSEAAFEKANPGYHIFMNKAEFRAQAANAQRMPARLASFRNHYLNQRVEAVNGFMAPEAWAACGAPPDDLTGREVYAGLDLSSVSDLTALVMIGRNVATGIWSVKAIFWLPSVGLAEKAARDHVPYGVWREEGWLLTTPGPTVSYEYVASYLFNEVFPKYKVAKIGFDPWNFSQFKPYLLAAGFSETVIAERFAQFKQGAANMTPAIRQIESLTLEKKFKHGDNPILASCMANAVVEGDESNRRLSKKRSTGRIDGAVALAMAVGVSPMGPPRFDPAALIG
jgi:phage terminase large subunit-like protein